MDIVLKRIIAITLVFTLFVLCGCFGKDKKQENNLKAESSNGLTEDKSLDNLKNEDNLSVTESVRQILPSVELSSETQLSELDSICERYGAVGVQVAVMKNFTTINTYNYGYSNEEEKISVKSDDKFRIASLSKFPTAIVLMCLVDQGLVDLDADISDYLGVEVRNPYYPDVVITPSMLLTHTASITDSEDFGSSRWNNSSTNIDELLTNSSSFSGSKPGTSYEYSNFSYAIVGCICEKVTGKNFNVLAKELLFEPLGIDASYIASELKDTSKIGTLYGEGGHSVSQQLETKFSAKLGQTHHIVQGNLTICAQDYLKIASVLMNDGMSPSGKRILSKDSVDKMLKIRYDAGYYGICYGSRTHSKIIDGLDLQTHNGCNFGMYSTFVFDPVKGNGVVVLTSGANGVNNENLQVYEICLELIRAIYPE